MKEYEFELLAKKTLIKAIPGCLNQLEEKGLTNESEIDTEELVSMASSALGVSAANIINFTKELLKEVLIKENVIEKN